MKYQVGDTILILHSNEEAIIVDIINDQMLMVDIKGVSFPVYKDQVDFPYFKRFTEKKIVPDKKPVKKYVDDIRKEKAPAEKQKEDGVWLTFIPVMQTDEFGDEIVETLKIHLNNRTEKGYQFKYTVHYFGKPGFTLDNEVRAFNDFYLHDIEFEQLNDSPVFAVDFSLPVPDKNKAPHYETFVRLKPKQLFAKIEELKKNNLAHFSQKLFDIYPDKAVEEHLDLGKLLNKGYKIYDAAHARQHLEPARSVVDLHIEKIMQDWKHLSNFEILSIQLKTFEKFYQLSLAHHQPGLTVIHGVGEGRLRDEIHDILRGKKEVKSFVNQYHPNFGYGATEIFFQY
jgi:hypothetical protein